MQSEKLIQSLKEQVTQFIKEAEKLKEKDFTKLTWRKSETSWNILECLAHLNLYGNFYLPQIEAKIKNANAKAEPEFKSGFLGNYFAQAMLPKENLYKMKTFKDKNPLNSNLDKAVIEQFIQQQMLLLQLLNQAKAISLNKVKIQTSISSLIKLNLGDTFRFFTNHILRHLKQIENIQLARKKA